jgi:hypothetical protein
MLESLKSQTQPSPRSQGTTRAIDTAVGILVGWRGCSTQAAFRELITASERHQVPIFAVAGALVNLASRDAGTPAGSSAAELAAEREWGERFLAVAERGFHSVRREVDRWI